MRMRGRRGLGLAKWPLTSAVFISRGGEGDDDVVSDYTDRHFRRGEFPGALTYLRTKAEAEATTKWISDGHRKECSNWPDMKKGKREDDISQKNPTVSLNIAYSQVFPSKCPFCSMSLSFPSVPLSQPICAPATSNEMRTFFARKRVKGEPDLSLSFETANCGADPRLGPPEDRLMFRLPTTEVARENRPFLLEAAAQGRKRKGRERGLERSSTRTRHVYCKCRILDAKMHLMECGAMRVRTHP